MYPPLCFDLVIKVIQQMHQACLSHRVFCMQPASLLGAAHVSVACSPDCSCCELPCRLQQRLRPNKQTYAASICRSSWQSSRRASMGWRRKLSSCRKTWQTRKPLCKHVNLGASSTMLFHKLLMGLHSSTQFHGACCMVFAHRYLTCSAVRRGMQSVWSMWCEGL